MTQIKLVQERNTLTDLKTYWVELDGIRVHESITGDVSVANKNYDHLKRREAVKDEITTLKSEEI